MQTITLQQHIGQHLLVMSTEIQPQTYRRVADPRDQLLPRPAGCLCRSSAHHPSLPKLLQAGQCRQARHTAAGVASSSQAPSPAHDSHPGLRPWQRTCSSGTSVPAAREPCASCLARRCGSWSRPAWAAQATSSTNRCTASHPTLHQSSEHRIQACFIQGTAGPWTPWLAV